MPQYGITIDIVVDAKDQDEALLEANKKLRQGEYYAEVICIDGTE
jgi:hypothetical protein